ncbi:T9SS type A sorting domain-containing protein [bacterium]|nr:T9SS type A sorting domain-containing protein [bacterium]
MKKIIALLALLSLVATAALSESHLGECYTSRAELYDYLFTLQDSAQILGPNFSHVRVDSIGHSRGDQLGVQYPIYAVKFSDNVDEFEDEPTCLIVGHIHAEEVAGLEGIIEFMRYLTYRRLQQPYAEMINETQIYIIPTINPDGLEVISSGLTLGDTTIYDNTWRKNGYKPPQLDECNISPSYGGELCGVDQNRNFELNWIWGDTLWHPTDFEVYDYYRGPGPMSEPETQCLADFAMEIKPTTSIVWHSSRSGRFGSQTFGAWEWGEDDAPKKHSPDSLAIRRLQGSANAGFTSTTTRWGESSTSPYSAVWAGTQNGALQDWFYWKLGCIQMTVETSPEASSPPANIQPPCTGAPNTTLASLVQTLLLPNEWMCRRLINLERSGTNDMNGQGAALAIYTKDAETDAPISAEWRNVDSWTALLPPWYTNEQYGRATFLPLPGPFTVMARKEGYLPDTATVTINPGASQTASVTLRLTPLPWHDLTIHVEDESGNSIPAKLHLISDFPQWTTTSGTISISKPRGAYQIGVIPEAGDKIAIWSHFWLGQDTSFTYVLPAGDTVFYEGFDEHGLDNWTRSGDNGDRWGLDPDTTAMNYGQSLHTNPNSDVYRPTYARNADTWIQYDNTIDLTSAGINSAHLAFDRRGRLEVPLDSFFVEVSTDGSAWEVAQGYCDIELPWTRDWVNLTRWVGNTIYLRFRLQTDHSLQELGLNIDNVVIMAGLDEDGEETPAVVPYSYKITNAYPNPFNPSTTIDYEVAAPGLVSFGIFNLLGQQVWHSDKTLPAAGSYRFRWDGVGTTGQAMASGIYFIRMKTDVVHSTKKLMLLK